MTAWSIGVRTLAVSLALGGALALGVSGAETTAAGVETRPSGGLVIVSQDGEVVRVTQYRGDDQRAFMRGLARQADADGNRALSRAEVDANFAGRMADGDRDGSGTFSAAEFREAFGALSANTGAAFRTLDENGDGAVSAAEIDGRFGDLVARMDRDGDGQLSRADRPGR